MKWLKNKVVHIIVVGVVSIALKFAPPGLSQIITGPVVATVEAVLNYIADLPEQGEIIQPQSNGEADNGK